MTIFNQKLKSFDHFCIVIVNYTKKTMVRDQRDYDIEKRNLEKRPNLGPPVA